MKKLVYKTFSRRPVVIVDGVPFYSSTGSNSQSSNTWFPLLACVGGGYFGKPGDLATLKLELGKLTQEQESQFNQLSDELVNGIGDSWKLLENELPDDALEEINTVLDTELQHGVMGNTLRIRFGSLCTMLISARLSENQAENMHDFSFWDFDQGKNFLQKILENSESCRNFYEGLPKFKVEQHPEDEFSRNPDLLNRWIEENISNQFPSYSKEEPYKNFTEIPLEDLLLRFPRTFDDYYDNNLKQGDPKLIQDEVQTKTPNGILTHPTQPDYLKNKNLYLSHLDSAVAANDHEKVIDLLSTYPSLPHRLSEAPFNILETAAALSDVEMLEIILEKMREKRENNVDVFLTVRTGRETKKMNTPFLSACQAGKIENAAFLENHGADVNYQNNDGNTALHYAIANRDDEVLTHLLNSPSVNINIADKNGRTALHQAATQGDVELLSRLIDKGGNLDTKDYLGFTPLGYARAKFPENKQLHQLFQKFDPLLVSLEINKIPNGMIMGRWNHDSKTANYKYGTYTWEGSKGQYNQLLISDFVLGEMIEQLKEGKLIDDLELDRVMESYKEIKDQILASSFFETYKEDLKTLSLLMNSNVSIQNEFGDVQGIIEDILGKQISQEQFDHLQNLDTYLSLREAPIPLKSVDEMVKEESLDLLKNLSKQATQYRDAKREQPRGLLSWAKQGAKYYAGSIDLDGDVIALCENVVNNINNNPSSDIHSTMNEFRDSLSKLKEYHPKSNFKMDNIESQLSDIVERSSKNVQNVQNRQKPKR